MVYQKTGTLETKTEKGKEALECGEEGGGCTIIL